MDEIDWDEETVRRMSEDPIARRELLWLRAKEKGDDDTVLDLERVDAELADRMRDVEWIDDLPDDRKRRDAYGRAWDQRWKFHAFRLRSRSNG
jgi:hypothetical protein